MVSPRDPWLASLDELLKEADGEHLWFATVRARLEEAYLGAQTPLAQSGFSGDSSAWEQARRPIVSAVDRSGSYLDIGAANGFLLESLTEWAKDAGHIIEPYGLDYSPALVSMACHRYPQWSHRFFTGNALDWQPTSLYDFVRTELVYAPPARERDYINRLLAEVVVPGGRLIVCSYGSSRRPAPRAEPVEEILQTWGYNVAGTATGMRDGVTVTHVAWIDSN